MKRTLLLLLMIMTAFSVAACGTIDNGSDDTTDGYDDNIINIYHMNDLHGALTDEQGGMHMANVGNFLVDEKTNNPENTIIVAGGDMVQGTLLSNYFYGENVVEVMDAVGFDAAAIGNHEFDWGLEKVTRYYQDTDEDVHRAEHPMLGANVFYEGTETIPDGIEPYTILERGEWEIGIIGTIGYGLESSILAPMVEDYEFADPVPVVEDHARMLREEKDVDSVILITHDPGEADLGSDLNASVAAFPEDARVDAVFNGHRHYERIDWYGDMPTMESGDDGEYVGHVQLEMSEDGAVATYAANLSQTDVSRFWERNEDVERLIEGYQEDISHLFEPVTKADSDASQYDLAEWMARLMMKGTEADIGIQNSGGTRTDYSAGEDISHARLYDAFPFDNTVVTVEVPGDVAAQVMDDNVYASNVDHIESDETYKVATNNYIFHHERNELEQAGENIIYKEAEMFEFAVGALEWMVDEYDSFDTGHTLNLGYYEEWVETD